MKKITSEQNKTMQRINNNLIEIHRYFMCFFLLAANTGYIAEMFSG